MVQARTHIDGHDDGYTLYEVLIVVVILSLLTAIGLSVFIGQKSKATDATLEYDLKIAAIASQAFLMDNPTLSGPPTAATNSDMDVMLSTYGYRRSGGNSVLVVTTPGTGFCLLSFNGSSDKYPELELAMLFDSAAGGFIDRADVPPEGACSA